MYNVKISRMVMISPWGRGAQGLLEKDGPFADESYVRKGRAFCGWQGDSKVYPWVFARI
jgi:hypothetical protein